MAENPREHEHLRLVVDAAPVAIIVADESGRITLVNIQAERLFNYHRGEMLGQPLEMLVPERFRRGHAGLRAGFHKTPLMRPMGAGRDLFGLRKDGTEVPIEIGLSPFMTPDGSFVLATIVDITERKYAEELRLLTAREQRKRLDAELDRDRALDASLLKSQFVATMSHELRTPLTTIIGMTELLSGTSLEDRQRRYCEQVNESAEALLSIINSILDFSKIEAGKIDLDERDFELQAVVESAASVLAPQIRQKSLRLHTYVDPLIPPLVRGDADRLMQILLNLIGNAVKFTQRGNVVVRALPVEMSLQRVVIRFEVQDTGIGISEETSPRLFEPFVQADNSSSRKYGGTGLGLSICKRLVTLMGGEIGVESEPGCGSLFWFSVPFKRPNAVFSSRKVFGVCALVVSDDETFADIVVRYLEAWGMASRRIRAATEIRTTLESANAATPPEWIAVVDADAANSGTVAAALAAEAEIGPSRIIAVGDEENQLSKPIRQSELFDRVSDALGKTARIESVTLEAPPFRPRSSQPGASETVLVAEDNASIQELLGHQLRALGIDAKLVSDGAEAVAALRQERFGAVLMDCQMPNLDGFEATRLIREEEQRSGRHTPIIAMTANAFKEDREACLAAGMDDYLAKPVRMEALRGMLERWLSQSVETAGR
jgi:PAS domain S-box-containing protein